MILEGRGEGRWGAEQIPLLQPSSTPLCFYCPTPTSTLPHPHWEEAWGRDCSGMETLGGDKQTQPLMHCPPLLPKPPRLSIPLTTQEAPQVVVQLGKQVP